MNKQNDKPMVVTTVRLPKELYFTVKWMALHSRIPLNKLFLDAITAHAAEKPLESIAEP